MMDFVFHSFSFPLIKYPDTAKQNENYIYDFLYEKPFMNGWERLCQLLCGLIPVLSQH